MPKSTPEQRFAKYYATFMDAATNENVRAEAKRQIEAWFKRHDKEYPKKWGDIPSILLKAAKDEEAANPPPQTPDPRDNASVRYDPKRHNPASLVENIVKAYVTMPEHARVILVLWICFTHVYTRFSIAPRVALASKKPGCGKSTALEIARRLVFKPNQEAVGTGAAIEEHFARGPCTLLLDEVEHADAEARKRLQRIWNAGHKTGPGSKISKMVAGKKQSISLHAPVLLAGVGKGVGRLLVTQQQSRTLRLEMLKYTEETMPPRNYYIEEEVDVEAFNSVYLLLCGRAAKVKLNPKPPMPPGVIARDADNIRGLLAIADDCGGEWPRRAREALMALREQQKAESPEIAILRHGVVIFDTLELERIKTTEFDKELHRLDLPGANWRRYRGPGGDENEHAITASERAELLRESGIESKPMRPVGGGKLFRGLDRSWFEAALRGARASSRGAPPAADHPQGRVGVTAVTSRSKLMTLKWELKQARGHWVCFEAAASPAVGGHYIVAGNRVSGGGRARGFYVSYAKDGVQQPVFWRPGTGNMVKTEAEAMAVAEAHHRRRLIIFPDPRSRMERPSPPARRPPVR